MQVTKYIYIIDNISKKGNCLSYCLFLLEYLTFLRHFVKANPWGFCRRSTTCQSSNWTRRFQCRRTLVIIRLTKSLDSWELSVSFRQGQNNLARIYVHILGGKMTVFLSHFVVREGLWVRNLYWSITLKFITAKTTSLFEMLEWIQAEFAKETCNDAQTLCNMS